MEILIMFQKLSIAAMATMLTASAANAATVQLQPIPDAFARLGHSCGGIKQQIFGEGFDAIGNVTGYVFALTRCGGFGRGGGYQTTPHSTLGTLTWSLTSRLIDQVNAVLNPS